MADDVKSYELPVYDAPSGPAPVSTLLPNSIMAPQIDGSTQIANGTIFAKSIVVGAQPWSHTLVWTATNYQSISWGSGAIQFADGSIYQIVAGTATNAATYYVYFDKTLPTVLQVTTTFANAVSDNRILLLIVQPASNTSAKAILSSMGATGTTIDGSKIVTGKIQSTDGKTYFDLDGKRIIVNDGTNDRVLIGFQSGGF